MAPAARFGAVARGLLWRRIGSSEEETRSPKEHAMMFAIALAIVGVAVLGSLELAAAHAR